jgi:hypothetical protein
MLLGLQLDVLLLLLLLLLLLSVLGPGEEVMH